MKELNLPPIFFYNVSTEGDEFTQQPSNQLSVSQIIANRQDYWINSKPVQIQKKKTLILNDWTLSLANSRDQDFKKETLKQLLEASPPFEIFARGQNGLIEVNIGNINSFFNTEFARSDQGHINRLIQNKGLNAEECLHLDSYLFQQLKGEETEDYCVYLSDIFQSKESENTLFSIISSYHENKKIKIIVDNYSDRLMSFYNELKQSVLKLDAHVEFVFSHLEIVGGQGTEAVLQMDESENISFEGVESSRVNNFEKTESIKLYNTVSSPEALSTLLNQCAGHLKNLLLPEFRIEDLNKPLSLKKDFPLLKILTLSKMQVSAEQLNELLSRCTQLEQLEIEHIAVIDKINWELPNLASLTEIKIINRRRLEVSSKSLYKILTHCKNLKKLELLYSNITDDFDWSDDCSFNLESISLGGCSLNCSGEAFKQLINRSNNLKYLKLIEFNISKEFNWPELNFPSLEKLYFNLIRTKGEIFPSVFLENCPKLKELSVSGLNINQFDTNKLKLASLESFSLRRDFSPPKNIEVLLNKIPSLKALHADGKTFSYIDWNNVHTSSLESISIHNCPMSTENLNKVLNSAPKLKDLTLNAVPNYRKINWWYKYKNLPMDLESIKIIDNRGEEKDRIIFSSIVEFCAKIPKLKILELPDCNLYSHWDSLVSYKSDVQSLPLFQQLECLILHTEYHCTEFSDINRFLGACKNLISYDVVPRHIPINNYIMNAADTANTSASSQQSQFTVPFELENHYNRPAPKTDFNYQGTHKHLNQMMVVDQLSQYLTLSQQYQPLISKIQVGICLALSACFLKSPATWTEKLTLVKSWDGNQSSLSDELQEIFNEIIHAIINPSNAPICQTYLGDYLEAFLAENQGNFLIYNPWHRIAICFDQAKKQWQVYDPNYNAGAIFVEHEQLASRLRQEQGQLIMIEGQYHAPAVNSIQDIDQFLKNGGFLLLFQLKHQSLFDYVSKRQDINSISPEALKGLIIQNSYAVPAWVSGLASEQTRDFYYQCIRQYLMKVPADAFDHLKQSLAVLPEEFKEKWMEVLESIKGGQSLSNNKLKDAKDILADWQHQHSPSNDNEKEANNLSEHQLTLVEQPPSEESIMTKWVNHYREELNPKGKTKKQNALYSNSASKVLLQTQNIIAQHECLLKVYQDAIDNNRKVFWINRPEDLCCSSPWVQNESGTGRLMEGPGGPLYDFLMAGHTKPLLLINYDNFKPQDVIRFNNLLDDSREADGVKLPADIQVVAVQNTQNPEAYLGEDFLSRFDQRRPYIAKRDEPWQFEQSHAAIAASSSDEGPVEINLFHASDWQQQLLGYWQIDGQQLKWIEGALSSGKTLVIYNGPESEADYQLFWQRLAIDKSIDDKPLDIERIHHRQHYNWQELTGEHQFAQVPSNEFFNNKYILCNRGSLTELFSHYIISNECQGLVNIPGLLESQTNQTLPLLVTENLYPDQWAKLLATANKNNKKLIINLLPGVTLPAMMSSPLSLPAPRELAVEVDVSLPPSQRIAGSSSATSASNASSSHSSPFIYTNDRDVFLFKLSQQKTDAIILDVSALEPTELLKCLDARIDLAEHRFIFEEKTGFLAKALESSDTTIILTGTFSRQMLDALLPYVRNYPERLLLVNEDSKQFLAFQPINLSYTLEEKLSCLSTIEQQLLQDFSQNVLNNFSLAKLKALAAYQNFYPQNRNPRAPWENYYRLKDLRVSENIDYQTAAVQTEEFIQNRFELIESHLSNSPFVFIGGMTGVGKSTFINEHFSSRYPGKVYLSEEKMSEWANNPEGGYLFIDEANISQRDWSEFEGLFQQPPRLFINGQLKEVTPAHKVIFAGNPLNYSPYAARVA